MTEKLINRVKLTNSPENFEVLAQIEGFADTIIEGEISQLSLSMGEAVYIRVISESDGVPALPPVEVCLDDDGRFSLNLRGIPTGGPYTVDFVALNRAACTKSVLPGDRICHLFVGDIYLIAGQSNAAGRARGFVFDEPELGVSVYRNLESWDIASMPFADELDSNMFLRFAKEIRRRTGTPIGLIPAAACDSPLSRWLLSEDGDLYRRAMCAVGGRRIKAVLWYQGCRDAGDGVGMEEYLSRFENMVNDMRRELGSPDLPVFTFQLNRQRRKETSDSLHRSYDGIREAQRRAAMIPNVSVLPAIDALNMSDFIHNSQSSNFMLGERLALCVLKKVYGIGLGADAPEIKSARLVSSDTVRLEFSNVTEYLSYLNATLSAYPIVLEDALGAVPLHSVSLSDMTVEIRGQRGIVLPAFVSGQTGTDPETYIIDYGTGIPALCFSQYPVEG